MKKTFFVPVSVIQKLIFFIRYERNARIIYKIFLLYGIFHGVLKYNHKNVSCKESLEPSSPSVCLEQDYYQYQDLWIRPHGLDMSRYENLHGWRVYSYAITCSYVELPS